jgi:hypothetical protein
MFRLTVSAVDVFFLGCLETFFFSIWIICVLFCIIPQHCPEFAIFCEYVDGVLSRVACMCPQCNSIGTIMQSAHTCVLGKTKAFAYAYATIVKFVFLVLFLLLMFTYGVGCSEEYSFVCSASRPKFVNEVRISGYDCFPLYFGAILGSYCYIACVLRIYLFHADFLVISVCAWF